MRLRNMLTEQVVEFSDGPGTFLQDVPDPQNWVPADAADPIDGAEPPLEGSLLQPDAYGELIVPEGVALDDLPSLVERSPGRPVPGYRAVRLAEVVALAFRSSGLITSDWNRNTDLRERLISEKVEALRELAASRSIRVL